ncbi:hypothetical protein CJU94_19940 [Paraburkholderia aromaticivorans]|uniref:Uncharacterized protein n=1 Tax=Paraburkholderia aromaticivorans TaxID=2026199 RepID=A0A248VPV1_9BURK|nr:hypothetical protein CJU94_19940 [Paraburkholderia aromaticivorans]
MRQVDRGGREQADRAGRECGRPRIAMYAVQARSAGHPASAAMAAMTIGIALFILRPAMRLILM